MCNLNLRRRPRLKQISAFEMFVLNSMLDTHGVCPKKGTFGRSHLHGGQHQPPTNGILGSLTIDKSSIFILPIRISRFSIDWYNMTSIIGQGSSIRDGVVHLVGRKATRSIAGLCNIERC
jgi:hypothetical protein